MGQPNLDQVSWRIGDDDNSDPDSCTWYGSCGSNSQAVALEENFMVRITVENNGAKSTGATTWQLYVNTSDNPTTAVQVTTATTGARIVSGTPTDGAACNSQICSGTGTFTNGEYNDANDEITNFELAANGTDYWTELQFCVRFQSTTDTSTPYRYFFLREAGTALDAHTAGGAYVPIDVPIIETATVAPRSAAWSAPAVTAKTNFRHWVGSTTSWNTSSNWSYTSGGTGGADVPTINEDVVFDTGSQACTVDVATANCKSFTKNGYTGVFSAGNNNMNIGAGGLTCGGGANGTITMGSGTWTCAGDFYVGGQISTWNQDTSTLRMTGASKTVTLENGVSQLYHLQVANATTLATTGTSARIDGTLTVETSQTLTLSTACNNYLSTSSTVVQSGATVACGANNLNVKSVTQNDGEFTGSGTMNVRAFYGTAEATSGKYYCTTTKFLNLTNDPRSLTLSGTGTFDFDGNVSFETGGTGALTVTVSQDANFTFSGNLSIVEATFPVNWTKGTGTFTFDGTSDSTITPASGFTDILEDFVISKGTDTAKVTLAGNVYTDSFTGTQGRFDLDSYTATLSGALTLSTNSGFQLHNGTDNNMDNGKFVLGANSTVDGEAGTQLQINNLDFDLNTSYTLTATYCTIATSDCTNGTGDATSPTNTDGDNNTNWNFGSVTATVAPESATWSAVEPAAKITLTETATVAPESATWSAPAVSAKFTLAATVAPESATWSAVNPAAEEVVHIDAVVAPESATWSAVEPAATFTVTATVAPESATWSAVNPAPTFTVVAEHSTGGIYGGVATWSAVEPAAVVTTGFTETATVAPESATWSAVEPAAVYIKLVTATVAPDTATWSAQAVSAGVILTATVAPDTATWSAVDPAPTFTVTAAVAPDTATWSAVDPAPTFTVTAVVAPDTATWSAPNVAGSTGQATSAAVAPVVATWSAIAPTPTFTLIASVAPDTATWSAQVVSAGVILTASVAPDTATWTAPAVAAVEKQLETAAVAPVAASWSAVDPAPTFTVRASVAPDTAVWTAPAVTAGSKLVATVAPQAATWSTPAVTANTGATKVAAVSPVPAAWSAPAVNASFATVAIASVAPVSASWSATTLTAGVTQVEVAVLAPESATWSAPAVSATSGTFQIAQVAPVIASWSILEPRVNSRITVAVDPSVATWSAPGLYAQSDIGVGNYLPMTLGIPL